MKLINSIMTTLLIVTACASSNSTSISTMPLDERNAKYAASKSDVTVCRIGTTSDGEQWETSVPWFIANANEAMSRGLSLKDCNNLTKKNKKDITTEEIITSGTGDSDINIIGSGS